jgi:DNA repair ATPase RecN
VVPATPLATEVILRRLAYADRARRMQPAELSQEVTRLGDVVRPTEQVQLALVLSQLHQLPELIRAQELLARVLANTGSEAQTLQPLVGLLASRFGEQRRVEDQLEKQTQQTREVQRRLDQTNERLEALKAIERSLTNRPAPAASAPTSSSRGSRAPAP